MSKSSELRGLIQESINANPESWRLFFQKYNCDGSCPEKSIVKAYGMYGDVVASDVNNILSKSYASFLGGDGLTSEEQLQRIKDISDKLRDCLTNDDDVNIDVKTSSEKDKDDKSKRTIFIVFVSVVVVCSVVFIVVRKMKK